MNKMKNIVIQEKFVKIKIDKNLKQEGNYQFQDENDCLKFDFINELEPVFKEEKTYKSGETYLERFEKGIFQYLKRNNYDIEKSKLVTSLQKDYDTWKDLIKEKCFCEFKLPKNIQRSSGVYLWVLGNEIQYVGEALDIKSRFNSGYGHISPRNIFTGGQSTNCKMNLLVGKTKEKSEKFKIFFYNTTEYDQEKTKNGKTTEREEVEKYLINYIGLDKLWNKQL